MKLPRGANFDVKNEMTSLGDSFFGGACMDSFWREKKWHIVENDVGRSFNIKISPKILSLKL